MATVHHLSSEIGILGWACRLPGARDVASFWRLLHDGRCSVSEIPADRWSRERFGHPRRQVRGRSYTWAAGVVDDVWDFDPTLFGISPREAEQLDPQQRLLLELTWEALEDAGIRPSTLAGTQVGVFVGASSTDYANLRTGDPSFADGHFATGNALSVIANRISYVFDLKGPSLTIDTACSSSLVALHHAVEALRSRRIDTAVVAGVNVLASPFSFISFSQASMLSPTGRSRAFSADADGYVRAEGGVVLVLRRAPYNDLAAQGAHGLVVATDVNSDGRTSGIALPSAEAQETLIRKVYAAAGVDPNQLAFVEAHGTGTPVGDPIEASAIGAALGRRRSTPLPIGSVKTNIGHLEPAAGLAGLLKAMLALKHGVLPRSLHFTSPSPQIPFADLNLHVAGHQVPLELTQRVRFAGVNSFGFGGTNAHAIVAPFPVAETTSSPEAMTSSPLVISAKSNAALAGLAGRYAETIEGLTDAGAAAVVRAAAWRRERLQKRLAVHAPTAQAMAASLAAFARGETAGRAIAGTAPDDPLPIAFVYSGNGSQWVGMGRQAYRRNADFRAMLDKVDTHFSALAKWSLVESMMDASLAARLPLTSVAQPLIFAIQVATTHALEMRGITPSLVLGHSVGEVAAAHAAGALDLATAVRVIYFRSLRQELTAASGDMVVLGCAPETATELAGGVEGVEIAAYNSDRVVTLSGPGDAVDEVARRAGARGISTFPLNLGYPFHNALMEPSHGPLIEDLRAIVPHKEATPFVSTVTGGRLSGQQLGAAYWWRNVREPVLFSNAVRSAAALGARFFIEVGPRGSLQRHVKSCLEGRDGPCTSIAAFDSKISEHTEDDPIAAVVAQALVGGAAVAEEMIFGADQPGHVALPSYAWDRRTYRFEPTCEGIGYRVAAWHPLTGDRYLADGLEWRSVLDTAIEPDYADHQVAGQVILPGAAFLEMSLAVARQWLDTANVVVGELEIRKPLHLSSTEPRELRTCISPGSNTFEIASRPRLSGAPWLVHAHGKIYRGNPCSASQAPVCEAGTGATMSGVELYALAMQCGLDYGPAFRLVDRVTRVADDVIDVSLKAAKPRPAYLLDPMLVDACFHGLFVLFPELDPDSRGIAYIPARIHETAYHALGSQPVRAKITVRRRSPRSIQADFSLFGAGDELVAELKGARFVAVQARRRPLLENIAVLERLQPSLTIGDARSATFDSLAAVAHLRRHDDTTPTPPAADDSALVLEGWATAVAYEIVSALADDAQVDVAALLATRRLPAALKSWLLSLLDGLEVAGLVERGGDRWHVLPDPLMPRSSDVLAELMVHHPERATELLLAGAVGAIATQVAVERRITPDALATLAADPFDFYATVSRQAIEAATVLQSALAAGAQSSSSRPLALLIVGSGLLADALSRRSDAPGMQISVLETDAGDDCRATRRSTSIETYLSPDALPVRRFDLAVSVGCLSHIDEQVLGKIRDALKRGATLLAMEPPPCLFRNLVFGLRAACGERRAYASGMRSPARWSQLLSATRFETIQAAPIGEAVFAWTALVATTPGSDSHDDAAPGLIAPLAWRAANATSARSPLADALAARAGTAPACSLAALQDDDHARDLAIVLSPAKATDRTVETLTERILLLGALAGRLRQTPGTRLWLVHQDALAADARGPDPTEAAFWAYCRTLTNEFPHLDIRRVDVPRNVLPPIAAAQFERLLRAGTTETEIQITSDGFRVARVSPLGEPHATADAAQAARLVRNKMAPQRVAWQSVDRRAPGPGEVEIAVEATGLNFRDLMWSMDLLPDDMLEDGFTGPGLGLECAGVIARVGPSVTRVAVGDRIVGMAPEAFATHALTSERMVARIADDMPFAAAATVPVAFLTAYYALDTLANLRRGEAVLVHGAAGAVGLAAIQIAHQRGARVIATAGSTAKRGLLRAVGVSNVLNSRSTSFVEDIRNLTTDGVDVVLNSLAGEQMERSLQCLRPFGRFVELGKRDYVANTHVGLRPFRRNLSYFGVDVDQLIVGRADQGESVLDNVMRLIHDGVLTPLPYSTFDGARVSDAFQLMQHSHHIGKIVVHPPSPSAVAPAVTPFAIHPERTHLVTGAFGGFGMETARWLVAKGARNLVLLGRSGPASEEARTLVSDLEAAGAKVLAAGCDIADANATDALFATVKATMPPLAGVIHAAMVLDDGLIANLDSERIAQVLAPKVAGADNLDRCTRGDKLDYFVMFSSVTTMFGNPGQASYVTGNGYLEGLARRRRRLGLPGLALCWGPITDVGVVARDDKLKAALIARRGISGMPVAEALDLLGDALARANQDPQMAVLTISPRDWIKQVGTLPVLRAPTFVEFARDDAASAGDDGEDIDLHVLIASESAEAVREKVQSIIINRLATVLHMRGDDIDPARPLAEMGVDSLMVFELSSSLEKAFGMPIPMTAQLATLSIAGLADQMMIQAGRQADDTAVASIIADKHMANASADEVAVLQATSGADDVRRTRLTQ